METSNEKGVVRVKRLARFLLYYIAGLIGILIVSSAPILFQPSYLFNVAAFLDQFISLTKALMQPDSWTYFYLDREVSVFSMLWNPYLYSIRIFVSAIILGFLVAFILAIVTLFLPKIAMQSIKRLLGLLESIPDLMVAFLLQLGIVMIFQHTDMLLMRFVTLGNERIYLAPIVVLSFLPMVSLYRILILLIEEELIKDYVELARSKGIRQSFILVKHVLRNIMKSVFYQSKIIVWTTLSSLFVIEYMFNINGISSFVMADFRSIILAVVLWMIFTPLFVLYQGVEIFVFNESYDSHPVAPAKQVKRWQTLKQWGIRK